jgi:dihydroflavonol-4-reductase
MFSGLQQDFDISKARKELGFNPKNSSQVVIEAMKYLQENKEKENLTKVKF